MLQFTVNGAVPPVMDTLAVPFALPQNAAVVAAVAVMAKGAVRVVEPVTLQPLLSVKVTLKVPVPNALRLAVVLPFDHK